MQKTGKISFLFFINLETGVKSQKFKQSILAGIFEKKSKLNGVLSR